jgi:hypothetical protein
MYHIYGCAKLMFFSLHEGYSVVVIPVSGGGGGWGTDDGH